MNITPEQLRQFIGRIENLNDEKTVLQDGIKEVYAEAKANGFEPKILREVIKLRKLSPDERSEKQHLLDAYMVALGMANAD
jgi:uncharacterized protein (UPF0335 family)